MISTFGIDHRESHWYKFTTYLINPHEGNEHHRRTECQFEGFENGQWVELTADAIRYHVNRFDRDELYTYSDWTLPAGTRGTIRQMFTTLGYEFVTLNIDGLPYLIAIVPFAAIQAPQLVPALNLKQRIKQRRLF